MPHSSGGGSHSGGSHSGSGFSSSSSSSGGSSAKHIKNTSFPGARRYVYYENYRPVYIYADYDIRKGTASGKVWSIIGSAVSLLFGIMLIALCYDKPQKMDTSPSYHCEIKDTAGVIDDMDKVQDAIVDFYDVTGIPVEIMTVNNEDWQGGYSELEYFAYDMYVTEFAKSLDYAWLHARDEYGLFGVDYSGECCDPKKWLLTQAAMVEMYARLAILNCNL